jgi:predicted metal-dependent phosphoesterase TrpH
MKLCDLHTHSTFSDGSYTPEELVAEAKAIGLSAIALCDHNTVSGLPRFLTAAVQIGIEAIPGVEFSADYHSVEVHIVGLFISPDRFGEVQALLADGVRRKEESNIALVRALNEAGYALDYDAIKAATPCGQVNRAHIAEALMVSGYAPSVNAAFKLFLSPQAGFYVPPKRVSATEVVAFIRSIGGVAVIAHPLVTLDEGSLREFLTETIPVGLVGMEVDYSDYDEKTTALAHVIADEFGLLPSGGSDFHGSVKPAIALGYGRGNLRVPYAYAEALRAALTP